MRGKSAGLDQYRAEEEGRRRTIAKLVGAHVEELIRLTSVLLRVCCSALDLLDVELLDPLLRRDIGNRADKSAVYATF